MTPRLIWWLTLIIACTHFCLAYFQNCQPFLNLDEYVSGRSHLPYQYRVLMAWVLRAGLQVFDGRRLGFRLPRAVSDPRVFIMFLTSWASVFGSVLFAWRSLLHLTSDRVYSRWASLLVIYMAYFQFPLVYGLNFLLPYDLPSLFFFSGCLFSVISRRTMLFYAFFVAGSFNRETICMSTLFFVIWRLHDGRKRNKLLAWFGHFLSQTLIFVAIRSYLHHLFIGNLPDTANVSVYYKLVYNLATIIRPQQWPVLFSVFGFTVPVIFVWRRWMRNEAMELGANVLLLWFVVMMLVGVIIEIRVFSELISYAALAVALILYNRFPGLHASPPGRAAELTPLG